MPIEVELPDGTIAEFPDGTPTGDMEKALRGYNQQNSAFSGVTTNVDTTGESPFAGVTSRAETTNNNADFDEQNRRGLGLAGRMIGQGVAGLGEFAINLATRGPQGEALLRSNGVNVPHPYQATSDALTRAGVPTYDTPTERVVGRVGEALTGTAATMGLGAVAAPGSFLTAAPGVQLASATTGGAAGGVAREMGASPGAELAATLVGGLAPGVAAGRSASQGGGQMARMAQAADDIGIPLRPEAVSGSGLLAKARSLLGSGSQGRYQKDVMAANKKLGDILGAPNVDPDQVFPTAVARAGREFDNIAQTYDFQLSPSNVRKMVNYRNTATRLGGAESPTVRAIDEFLNEATQLGTPTVPGQLFKKLDTELGSVPYDKVSNRDLRQFITSLRDDYKAGMRAEDSQLWDDLMRRYSDIKKVEPLYAKMSGQPIDPRQLLGAVTRKGSDKSAMAKGGGGELGRLARVGQNIRAPQPLFSPSMGIPAAAAYGAASVLGPIAGRVADSNWLARMLSGQQERPNTYADTLRAATLGTAQATDKRKDKK